MSDTNKAVFLSYASQDAEAAKRIAETLRAAGVEVWFDQNELVGGDAWDQKIRRQIKECALFVPLISATTNARPEGYFRLEWKLAVDRSHLLADDHPFLFPIVIDEVNDATARVPEKFREVQWTRLRLDETPAELATRISRLLGRGARAAAEPGSSAVPTAAPKPAEKTKRGFEKWWWLIFPVLGLSVPIISILKREPRPPHAPAVEAAARPETKPAVPARSEARRLADQAFALSVDKYDSTLDDFTAADALMKRAVALDADDGEVLARSAQLQFMFRNRGFDYARERIVLGREQAERAVRLVPDSAEAHVALSLAHRYTGNTAAMLEPLRRAIELDPNHARAQLWLGSRLMEVGNVDEGHELHERARRNPEWAPMADYYGFLQDFGNLRFAEADKRVRRSYTARPSANSGGGIALLHLTWTGDLDKAVAELSGVPATFQNSPRIVTLTTLVHLSRRAPDEALRVLDRLPDEFIRDSWFTGPKALLVGRAHALAGRTQAARLAWESGLRYSDEALKKDPTEAAVHRARGELLALLGRTEEAMAAAQTFDELTRGAVRNWGLSTATIYATLGRADLAVPKLAATLDVKTQGWPLTRTLLRQDPRWDPIRHDPAFRALIAEPAAVNEADTKRESPGAAPVDNKSVAVLAFANLSDDKANEYFSDGISEELLNVLAKVPGLKVSARTSAFFFKGKDVPVPEIAKQLGVAYVVEGSVRRSGDRVRITAQLIKAADGFHVWSETFTRDLKDVFAVQDEIAGLIARNLSLKIGMSGASESLNVEVLPLYYAALQAWNLRTVEGMNRAEELLDRALALEPNFARGHAAMAKVWVIRGELTDTLSPFGLRTSALAQRTQQKVDLALKLDPNCAEAYGALGVLCWDTWRTLEATSALRRATELNPNYASAHQWLGRVLSSQGYLDEGLASLKRAAEVDPLSQRILDNYGRLLLFAGRPKETLEMVERALVIQPGALQAQALKAQALVEIGQVDEAVRIVRTLPSNLSIISVQKVQVLAGGGHLDEVERMLPELVGGNVLAKVGALTALGRRDEALAALDANWFSANRADVLLFERLLDPLRREPRFLQLIEQLGLTESHARAQAWRATHLHAKGTRQ